MSKDTLIQMLVCVGIYAVCVTLLLARAVYLLNDRDK